MKHLCKRTVLVLQILLVCIFLHQFAYANVYYASPDGAGTGTLASPCSFSSGLSKLTGPGDTLYLRGGIYYLTAKVSINKNGSAAARIGIMAYPGEVPILDFSGQPYSSSNPGISLSATSTYIHIKGLVIRYAGDNGMINNGSYHIIENCEFYGNCDTGLQHKSGGNNLILNCDSHDNFDYESGGITAADFGGNADGFADKQYTNSDPNTYDGCRSWNNADDGWDFFEKIGNSVIKNSICYKNGPASFDMTNHPRYTVDKAWFDQFPMTVTNANGGTNNITLANYKNYGNGNGFKLGGNYTAHNVTLIRCLSVGNTVRGFDQNNNYGTMTIYNASAYQNAYNYGFWTSSGGTLVIKNSVSMSSTNSNTFSTKTVTNVNNSWNTSGITTNSSDFVSLDTSLILTPRNADGSYTTTFMNLVAGSDLIDAGVFTGVEYAGNNPDLGYYEYGTIDKYPPVVTSQNITQSVVLGNAITNIVFTWSGGATGLNVSTLPTGLTAVFDNTNQKLTIQGTPTTLGNNQFTVTSIGGAGAAIATDCNIYVTSATAKKIAYFTTLPLGIADSLIYKKLAANSDFTVIPVDAGVVVDYSSYDAVVMSPVPSSAATGFTALEALDKPKLLLKPFTLKNTVWNWITGNAVNTAQAGMTITNKSHEIFTGLTFSGTNSDELQLFSTVTTNAVTGITNSTWIATPAVSVLGNALGTTTTNSIVEVPVGTNMNGTTTTKRFVMIGVSEYSTAALTATATQLIENAVYYILGMSVPSTVPVRFYSVNISDNNGSAKLSWKVGAEIDIKNYSIQRSSNGVDFVSIATVDANGSEVYTCTDNAALSGKSYYRVVANEKMGKMLLSQILPFVNQSKAVAIIVAPNPIVNKKINLQLINVLKGTVAVDVYNSGLQKIYSTRFNNTGSATSAIINLPANSASGIYTLRVVLTNGETYTKNISVQ